MAAGSKRSTALHSISWKMVLPKRIELSTSPLPMECSTTELRQLGCDPCSDWRRFIADARPACQGIGVAAGGEEG
jgi:hypothetical protein